MKFADFEIAESLDDARAKLKALGRSGFAVAGGTSFQYLATRPGCVAVDISRIGLSGIEDVGESFVIGANTTLTDLVRYERPGWVLDQIATLIPTHQIRNISTIAGNIARLFPWSGIPQGLLVLDGAVTVHGDDVRQLPASEFFAKRPSKTLQPGELVTEIRVPKVKAPMGFGYKKENVTNSAFGLMSAAAAITVDGGTMTRVRVAVGDAVPAPQALPAIQEALEGKSADENSFTDVIGAAIADVNWQGREGMSNQFAAHLADIIIRDALTQALNHAKGDES